MEIVALKIWAGDSSINREFSIHSIKISISEIKNPLLLGTIAPAHILDLVVAVVFVVLVAILTILELMGLLLPVISMSHLVVWDG